MKKITYTIFVLFLVNISTFAQPLVTIQGTNQFPIAGDFNRYTNLNAFGFDASGVGSVLSKVWDFSGLSDTGSITDFNYVNPANLSAADGADKFPTATIARSETGATGHFYYKNTATNIDRIGFFAAANNWGVYTGGTKATEFKFPITAGQSVNSTYAGDSSIIDGFESTSITNGNVSISADMQGQMLLPSATFGTNITYTNVLRLHVVESFRIKAFVSGIALVNVLITDDYFYWFVEGVKSPLLIYGTTTTSESTNPPTPVLRYQKTPGVLSMANNVLENEVSIFPNPSNGIFNLKGVNNDLTNSKIEIFNSIGTQIYKSELKQDSNEIDISNQSKGIYFIKISNEGKTQTKKIILN
jgi:Secretion system C-terminal sorting domain